MTFTQEKRYQLNRGKREKKKEAKYIFTDRNAIPLPDNFFP